MMSKIIVVLVSAVFFISPCFGKGVNYPVINWQGLGLSRNQQAGISELDNKWKRINNNLGTRITNNKNNLRFILARPYTTDKQIRKLQSNILKDQKTLRYQAMEIFLEKRALLTPGQKEMLHKQFYEYKAGGQEKLPCRF